MSRTIVLLSGGIDSMLALDYALRSFSGVSALAVDYGQPHRVEVIAAKNVARAMYTPLRVLEVALPGAEPGPANVFPGRNIVLLSLAAAWAGYSGTVVIGANADDQTDYSDCRPEFFNAFEAVSGIGVHAPLLAMTKAAVVADARARGLPIHLTRSCYAPGPLPCRTCNACKLRAKAGA